MSVDSKHPLYSKRIGDWEQMRDTHGGERLVKEAGFKYLDPTSGMVEDGAKDNANTDGFANYSAYRSRARVPDFVKDAVEAFLGNMHNKPAVIELPKAMEYLLDRASLRNESLQMLLQRINQEQLISGRLGLLLDIQDDGDNSGNFYISLYQTEDVINWDDGDRENTEQQSLNLVVLNETEDERQTDFTWEEKRKFRVLVLGDPLENESPGKAIYRFGEFDDDHDFTEESLETPSQTGRGELNQIPFVFLNTKDIVPDPDDPPLMGLSNLQLGVYRAEADYRQSLFMQGQDTLVKIGVTTEDKKTRVGTGAAIEIPMGGDAKYIGVNGAGLPEQRQALENDYRRAERKTGHFMQESGGDAESGNALKIRGAARTATLNQIAITGAFGLEMLLRIGAIWMGLDPLTVTVTPNLDFVDDQMTGMELAQIMGSKTMGAPMALESVHKLMQAKGMTELTFEDEIKAMAKEEEAGIGLPPPSTDPNGPEEDDDDDDDDDPEKKDDDDKDEPGADDE